MFIATLSVVILLVGALVALMYTWRHDVQELRSVSAQKTELESVNQRLQASNEYLTQRIGKTTTVLQEEVARNVARDHEAAQNAPASTIVDTIRLRLREPFGEDEHTRIGTAPGRVPASTASGSPGNGPKTRC